MARKPRVKRPASGQPPLLWLPRKSVWEAPLGISADAAGTCGCDDSCEYVYKDKHTSKHTPHAEWFCTRLADHLRISVPPCEVIQLLSGELVFGSRWDGAVMHSAPPILPPWIALIKIGQIPIANVRGPLTRMYIFDLFVHNYDRHVWNFLVTAQRSGYAVLAFDFSRAWTVNGFPLPALPFDINHPDERTIKHRRVLVSEIGEYFDSNEVGIFIDQIKSVPKRVIRKILEESPSIWLTQNLRRRILSWWSSKEMMDRLDGIAKGVNDGTYL